MNNGEEEISFWTRDMDLAFQQVMIENEFREHMDQFERIAAGLAGQTAEEVKVHHDLLPLPVEDVCRIESGSIPLPNHIGEARCSSDSGGGGSRKQQDNLGRKVHHDLPVENICSIELGLIPLPNHIDEVHHDLPVEDICSIESALIPLPNHIDEVKCSSDSGGGNRKQQANPGRKKHIRWTAAEHDMFLLGLAKCGRGDWRGISRHYVKMKTPSQVASHAQKYFLHQDREPSSGRKHRRSIHDTSLEMLMDAMATTNNSMINGNSADQMQPAPTWSALPPSMQPAATWSAEPAPAWYALPSMQPAATWSADQPCHSVRSSPISLYPHQSQQEEDDGLLQSVVRSSYSRRNPVPYDPSTPSNS